MTEPCHYDIWKNLIVSAEIGEPNSREIKIDLELPIVKFISKYFDDVTPRRDKDFEFNEKMVSAVSVIKITVDEYTAKANDRR